MLQPESVLFAVRADGRICDKGKARWMAREQSRAEDPRAVAQAGPEDAGTELGIEDMAQDFPPGFLLVKKRQISDASPNDDCVGVEDIDHGGDGFGKLIPQPSKGIDGVRLSLFGVLGDGGEAQRFSALFLVEALQRRASDHRLHAPGSPAIAGVGFAADGIVSPLSCDAVQSANDFPVDDDPAAHPGSKNETNDYVRLLSCAQNRFGQSKAIGVV